MQAKKDEPLKVDLSWAAPNVKCWVDILKPGEKDSDCYLKATVAKVLDNSNVSIKFEADPNKEVTMRGDKIFPENKYDKLADGYNDMVDMENLSEAELLYNLALRFKLDLIFTYVGPTLIVLNPFRGISKLFTPEIEIEFQEAVASQKFVHKEHIPHIYAVPAAAITNMFEFGTPKPNQAIVIAGESGAGKTENTKFCMNFLTGLGKNPREKNKDDTSSVGAKILACNPILEAFGNAKTTRNDNSSRFGKYVALLVSKDKRDITGATIKNYLLEKSRVCSATSKERNYHAFYHLIKGGSDELLKTLGLSRNFQEFNYLKNTVLEDLKTVNDVEGYQDVCKSFKAMEFTDGEVYSVWAYTAASLLMGNVIIDPASFDETKNTPCSFKDEKPLKFIADILGVNFENLSKSLRYKITENKTGITESVLKEPDCNSAKDSLAKDLYNKLFDWLVKRLNYTTIPKEFLGLGELKIDVVTNDDKYYHVGLLDIFGFEILEPNSLEQLCINFTNEKLQQLYIEYVFNSEKKEFKNEGLEDYICELKFEDNTAVINLLDCNKAGQLGVFQLIDDTSAMGSATDSGLRDKIIDACFKVFPPPGDPRKSRPRDPIFIIKHTASPVDYVITGFKNKNKDELSKPINDCLLDSKNEDVKKVWKYLCKDEKEIDTSNIKPNPKEKFLSYKFVLQMKDLYYELDHCSCHFVRCIKPNPDKKQGVLKNFMTLEQIKYMGILDTIKVRKDSYPVRRLYKLFYQRYEYLHSKASMLMFEDHEARGSDFKQLAKELCKESAPNLQSNMILFGNTRIFMRLEAVADLEKKREIKLKKIKEWTAKLQKAIAYKKLRRGFMRYKEKMKKVIQGITAMQRLFRVRKEFAAFQRRLHALRKVKAQSVAVLVRRQIRNVVKKCVKIQAWWRMLHYRKKLLKLKQKIKMLYGIRKAAMAYAKVIKVVAAKKIVEEIVEDAAEFLTLKIKNAAAIEIQRWVRGHLTRCRYHDQVMQIRKAKEDIIFNRNVKILQRNIKGWIVRSVLGRLGRAASFIQGFMKMKWLSSMFQQLRTSSIKIQRAVRAWLARKHTIQERLQEYVGPETGMFEDMQSAEQMILFGPSGMKAMQRESVVMGANAMGISTSRTDKSKSGKKSTSKGNETSGGSPGAAGSNPKSKSGYVMTPNGLVRNSVSSNGSPEQEKINEKGRRDTESSEYTLTGNPYFSPEVLEKLNAAREISPYCAKKFNLFAKVIDFDMMTDMSDIYDPLWGLQVLSLQHECIETEADIQIFDLGETHTLAVSDNSKVFTFGWNDNFQLGRETSAGDYIFPYEPVIFPVDQFRPKSVACGENHNLLLDHAGNLYVWGDNSKGQLGIGHTDYSPKISILDFLIDDSVTQIKAKGHQSVAITKSGKAYFWPLSLPSGEVIAQPIELSFPQKTQILNASCGYDFTVLISKAGHVYSFGKDNRVGQLGHGDLLPREVPTLVEALKAERVTSVSCGYKHVVCKSSLGKVYTWGWGERGQLGHGKLKNETTPKLVESLYPYTKEKILMAQAGYKHTLVLLETKRVLWWGSTTGIKNQATPIECDLFSRIPDMNSDFTPVRVLTAWSKTMSVTYLTIADSRTTELQPVLKQKILSQLTAKIEEGSVFNDVLPPTVDSISKYFPMKLMVTFNPLETKHSPTKEAKLKQQAVKGSPNKSMSRVTTRKNTEVEGGPQYSSLLKSLRNNPPSFGARDEDYQDDYYEEPYQNQYQSQPINSKGLLSQRNSTSQKSGTTQSSNYQGMSKSSPKSKSPSPERYNASGNQSLLNKSSKKSPSPTRNEPVLKPEIVKKLREIKKKVDIITKTPKSKWSSTDIEFMKMASQPQMMAMLKNISY